MKVMLAAVNAKYIHTSLSVRTLYHYVNSAEVSFAEFTINEREYDVLSAIYRARPDAVLFSCYIWNIEFILKVADMLKKALPSVTVVFGGPEVSFDSIYYMKKYPFIDAVFYGEGEETVREFLERGLDIDGAVIRKNGNIIQNPPRKEICDLNSIPFPYSDEEIEAIKDKLIYYESSRGCPFRCSYCLSSTTHNVRFRDIEKVKHELMSFIRHKVRIVKFVDRTFNADRKRAAQLLRFIAENAAETTFHFEIAADLINDEITEILNSAPKGLFQLEIGVQSTNPRTIAAIDRKTDFDAICRAVKALKTVNSVHIHLDLIAGLPYEDLSSFKRSFDDVFALRPHVLQLGFLKLLRGTKIRLEENRFNYRYSSAPPYEVLSNDFMGFDDILLLKGVEEVFEKFYNSGVFSSAMEYLLSLYSSPFRLFDDIRIYFENSGISLVSQSRNHLYELMCGFRDDALLCDYLKFDYLSNSKNASTPPWSNIPFDTAFLKLRYEILTKDFISQYLPEFIGTPVREIIKHIHFERFLYDVLGSGDREDNVIIFDYMHKRQVKLLGY